VTPADGSADRRGTPSPGGAPSTRGGTPKPGTPSPGAPSPGAPSPDGAPSTRGDTPTRGGTPPDGAPPAADGAPSLPTPTVVPSHPHPRVAMIKRVVVLGVTAVGFYVVWPSLAKVFAAEPQLAKLNPLWGIPIFAAELASFACMWALLRLALNVRQWFPVATSQLASNAFSRIVPGGLVAGGPLQYDMLSRAGIASTRVAASVTAVSLISTATLLALPVLSIPVIILRGAPVNRSLLQVGSIALIACVAAIAIGAVLLFADAPLAAFGAVLQRLRNRLLRRRPPISDLPARLVDERDLIRRVLGGGWWKALLYAAGNWLLDLTALLLALAAVGAQPRASLVLLAYVVAAFLGMVPITPGGLGFVEAGLTATLGLAGIGAGQAVLATLLYRLVAYWLPMPIGAVAYGLHALRYGRRSRLRRGRVV
jgi:uncharacterized membrane protein YbhN (UPF0104 family)